uniref:Uncharacterized protein n=1 Tax=Cajanus cajan TaxID=3821 RepID=A0A151S274_CAJCA|nr:hypothetical protein KK1_029414 [Cajanus cajan]
MSTSFPGSENWELVLDVVMLDAFDDQMTRFCPFNTTRLPSSEILTIPEESFSGWFLLATHITVD